MLRLALAIVALGVVPVFAVAAQTHAWEPFVMLVRTKSPRPGN